MPQFRYVARQPDGKLMDGVLNCHDRAAAILQVEQQGGVPIKIEPVSAPASPAAQAGSTAAKQTPAAAPSKAVAPAEAAPQGPVLSLKHDQLYLFTEQLAYLLSAGMTLDEALGILVRRLKQPRLHGLSESLHRGLVEGRSLSQSMRQFPRIFSPLYVNMIAAGEISGALSEILRRLVLHLSEVKALRDRVQQALIYPCILVVAGIALIIVFMTVMVPQLTGFFTKTGQALPTPTQILLNVNYALTHYWWLGVAAVGAGFSGFKVFTRTQEGRRAWDAFVWHIPIFSSVIRYRYFAQFARTLGTLIENGVTLLRALELLEEISGNEYVRQKMTEVRSAVIDGATLSTAIAKARIFPELFADMMSVGEQTGKFGSTMQMIANIYERELDKQVKVVSAVIPPLIMLFIASVVGFVVYGILSAVFGLTSNLQSGHR